MQTFGPYKNKITAVVAVLVFALGFHLAAQKIGDRYLWPQGSGLRIDADKDPCVQLRQILGTGQPLPPSAQALIQSCFLEISYKIPPEAHSQAMALMAPSDLLDPLRGSLRPGQVAIALFPGVRTEMKRLCSKGALQDPYICKKDERQKADRLVDKQLIALLQSSDEIIYLRALQLSCGVGVRAAKIAEQLGATGVEIGQKNYASALFLKNCASPNNSSVMLKQLDVNNPALPMIALELARMDVQEAYVPLNQMIEQLPKGLPRLMVELAARQLE
ncbi:MAG: hypothetical protein CMK59_02240 [Proteobacteria bacterium]|nr:hypothetical protein [Pseudomonadota bacterium]